MVLIISYCCSPFFTQHCRTHTSNILVEDPEPSDSVEASEGSGFFRSHQRGRHARFQFEHASIVHPLEEGKDMAADPTSVPKNNTTVEINQVRVTLLRDKDVPLVSHIQVDDPSEVNFVKDPS
jgi:hypothetical protein